ncbi:oligopeptide:H+ symporter [Mycobacterium sp. 1274756.6]|uniref:peptide MFS transporter n=1 Tax=Mycobacterium sp. 1274756.6 TaxID=1834076 RepID=UPI0007FF3411|nr:oligopeptide:H+ symporter [Mycobacterium sp. 1274756.6]OBJ71011.1 MFS transporter [Mycobacterium sp. 1274756.6]
MHDTGRGQRTFFGHPRVLADLFGLELWERFSFYGMQGIVLYYMYYAADHGGLGIDRTVATGIVGAYGGGVYLATILGAWLADRVAGSERVLFLSAALVAAGHLGLAVLPGAAGLTVGLVAIAVGSGGVKATATAIVGALYDADDPRRDAGFLLFYLGVNIGALLGPLLTGLLQSTLGFHYGFGAAAAAMAAGLIQYARARGNLPDTAREVPRPLGPAQRRRVLAAASVATALVLAAAGTGVLTAANLAAVMAAAAGLAAVGYFAVILSSRQVSALERRRVLGFIPLFLASMAFWSLFQQQFTVLAIYSDQRLNRMLFGWQLPPSWVQAINPVFIVVFSGVFAALWTKLGDRQPGSPVKFAIGLTTMGVAFLAFLPLTGGGPGGTPLAAIVGILLLFTVAELFLSPIGLSVTTKLAPKAFHTQLIALFFLSVSLGTTAAGILAGHYDPGNEAPYFGVIGGTAVVLGMALAVAAPGIRRLIAGVR